MSENPIITELTPEQEALIPVFREKWRKIALSTERVDEEKATEAIKAGYKLIGEDEPDVIFFDGIYSAIEEIQDYSMIIKSLGPYADLMEGIRYPLKSELTIEEKIEKGYSQGPSMDDPQNLLSQHISIKIYEEVAEETYEQILEQWNLLYYFQLSQQLDEQSLYIPYDCDRKLHNELDALIAESSYYDYCISVLNYPYNQNQWDILQEIVKNCGWIFPYRDTCIVCNRPTSLFFDNQNNLHADGEPAIEYADGFKVYAHHGTWIPEKYGSIPSSQWKSQWLLSEENAELRRILIQVIGYNQICEELGAIELDSWNEYTLLKIENYTELESRKSKNPPEPMHLLKMTCPSTGDIHFLRVPPDTTSARVGITWVNWEIDPEEFEIQT
ncbi:hypothetical protein NIES267_06470 [Calothrix parasitica NIES-267]|uniref:DUF6745 domain-containing protein n=1 Tax=Calothrix parasitica NIES-267 TaxID=1973488 RepID=A0A1Z4LIV8_9CYAN|nr:hypothetical protein NIES267_06470 [Calothrix parasitica NIES-267]